MEIEFEHPELKVTDGYAEVSAIVCNPEILKLLLQQHDEGYQVFERLRSGEQQTAFCGGIQLLGGSGVLLEPQCCADLSDIESWREAARHRGRERDRMWVGHPCYEVSYQGGELSFFYEDDREWAPDADPHSPIISLGPEFLQQQLQECEVLLNSLASALIKLLGEDARRAALELAGLSTQTP